MKTPRPTPAFVLLALGFAAGIAVDRSLLSHHSFPGLVATANAAEPAAKAPAANAGIKRTILQTIDNPGSSTHEVVMGIAELAPGASSGMHRHPGVEVGYVLEGTATVEYQGRPAATFATGQSFSNHDAHNAVNRGNQPAKILAFYIVEKGKPLASPVP